MRTQLKMHQQNVSLWVVFEYQVSREVNHELFGNIPRWFPLGVIPEEMLE